MFTGACQQQMRVSGGAGVDVTRSMPPANFDLGSDHTLRAMGVVGGHLHGHYSIVDSSHYVWFRQGDAAPDPGDYVSALSGLTGVEVVLPASGQTDAQVATAVASALTSAGFTASAAGADVTVTGGNTWTPGPISYAESSYQGMVGVHDIRIENAFSAGGLNGLRLAQIDPASLPSGDFLVNGIAVRIGDSHATAFALGLYQGGTADDDLVGCTYLGALGSTDTANGANVWEYLQSDGIVVDPTQGRLWIAFSTSGSAAQLEFTISSQPAGSTSSFLIHNSNQCVVNAAGADDVAVSDPASFPSSITNSGATEQGIPPFRLAIQEISTLQSNMAPEFEFGTMDGKVDGERDPAHSLLFSANLQYFTGNSYNIPSDMRGLELSEYYIAYGNYSAGDDIRGFVGVGGDAVDDMNNAVFYDVGQTSGGSSSEWHSVASVPTGIPLDPGTRIWLAVKHDGVGSSALAYSGNAQFEGNEWGSAYLYNGNTTDSQYSGSTFDYDPTVAEPTGATSFSGTHNNNNNNIGVRATAVTTGWG